MRQIKDIKLITRKVTKRMTSGFMTQIMKGRGYNDDDDADEPESKVSFAKTLTTI